MKGTVRALSLIVFAFPMSAVAQERAFLEPLTNVEEAEARALNNYFIRKHTFSASRYRLVKVDFSVLDSKESIAIPLFDDARMLVDFDQLEVNRATGGYIWRGEMVQDKVSPDAILDHIPNVEVAQKIFASMTDVTILVDLLEQDRKSKANLGRVYGLLEAMVPVDEKPDLYKSRYTSPDNVLGATATFRTLGNPDSEYHLRMLGIGGPYHILWEVDPSRVIYPTANDAIVPGVDPGPENIAGRPEDLVERRRQQDLVQEYKEFHDSLGDNPLDDAYEEKLKRAESPE